MQTNLNLEKTTTLNKNPKILLVDDDNVFAGMLKRNLEGVGYRVEHCDNGEKAWQQFQKKNYDMCLVDIVMPKMNGFQALRALRAAAESATLPVIMLTSKDQPADQFWAEEVGASAYLTKPVEIPLLLDTIAARIGAP